MVVEVWLWELSKASYGIAAQTYAFAFAPRTGLCEPIPLFAPDWAASSPEVRL